MSWLFSQFEKIALGLLLVALLVWLHLLLAELGKANSQLETIRSASEPGRWQDEDKGIPVLATEDFRGLDRLQSGDLRWRAGDAADGATLLDPATHIYCANPECRYLIPYNVENCPRCGTFQGEEVVERDKDMDGDLIPNDIEEKYAFLDPRNRLDARRDQDGDTFDNYEEIVQYKTRPDDAGSHPPLAMRVRYRNVQRENLPIRLYTVRTGGSEDRTRWLVFLEIQRTAARPFNLGDTVMNDQYTIVDVEYTTKVEFDKSVNMEREMEYSAVTLEDTKGERYRLERGQTTKAKGVIVTLIHLTDLYSVRNAPVLRAAPGDNVVLTDPAGNRETYQLLYDEQRGSVSLQGPRIDDNPGDLHAIARFNPRRDLRIRDLEPVDAPRDGLPEPMPGFPGMPME